MAGDFLRTAVGGLVNYVLGGAEEEKRQKKLDKKFDPKIAQLEGVDKPKRGINSGPFRGEGGYADPMKPHIQLATESLSPEARRGLHQAGVGAYTPNQPGQYDVSTQPSMEDVGGAVIGGALNRFETEQELETDLKNRTKQYEDSYDQSMTNMEGTYGEIQDSEKQGLDYMNKMHGDARSALGAAQTTADTNLSGTLSNIDDQMAQFQNDSRAILDQMKTLSGEALAAHADQSAKILENALDATQGQLQSELASIDADPNLTPGQKQALKQRSQFTTGSALRKTATDVYNQEAMRKDEIIKSNNTLTSNLLGTIENANAQLRAQGVVTEAGARATNTEAHVEVANAVKELNKGFADLSNNYRVSNTQNKVALRTSMEGLRLSGRQDLYNMASATPRAYLDLGQEYAGLYAGFLGENQLQFDRSMAELNAELAVQGLVGSQTNPFGYAGTTGAMQAVNQWAAPRPEQSSQNGQVIGAGIEGASTLGAAVINASDGNLKNSISTLKDSLYKISKLRGVDFHWNLKEGPKEIGLIAQEVKEVVPEAVGTMPSGHLGVDYSRLVPLLIEGIKHLTKRVEELESR